MLPKSILERVSEGYENVWKAFIKPEVFRYDPGQLGPPIYLSQNGNTLAREDFTVTNTSYKKLYCSVYTPDKYLQNSDEPTCLVYLHSQTGCRLEGLMLRDYCADAKIGLCLFDFAACGMSEGEFVSLGWHEKNDLRIVCLIDSGFRRTERDIQVHEILFVGKKHGGGDSDTILRNE